MPKPKTSRKALFRAALAISEQTAEQWADREGITAGHLSQVLSERRESATLAEKIDAFIAKHLAGTKALAS